MEIIERKKDKNYRHGQLLIHPSTKLCRAVYSVIFGVP